MAAALVGTNAAPTLGAAAAAVTPAWGTSQTRAAGNLLICCVGGMTATSAGPYTAPALPSGWTQAVIGAQFISSSSPIQPVAVIFFKVATGGDAAPTFGAVAGQAWVAWLGEFSGCGTAADRVVGGNNQGNSIANTTITSPGTDAQTGELVVVLNVNPYTTAATRTITDSVNNATLIAQNNNATSTTFHYNLGYGFTTSNAAADIDSSSVSTVSKWCGNGVVMATFLLASVAAPLLPQQHRRRPEAAVAGRISRGRF